MGEKELNILKQAIDLALAAGVYKNTQDVVLIHNALLGLQTILTPKEVSEKSPIKNIGLVEANAKSVSKDASVAIALEPKKGK